MWPKKSAGHLTSVVLKYIRGTDSPNRNSPKWVLVLIKFLIDDYQRTI
jgi:hypothetical protein